MCDTSNVPCDPLHATYDHDHPPPETLLRPKTPVPDDSRTLRRTLSYASIDTIRPSSTKGIRRRINEIADGLKHKSTKKKRQHPSTPDVPKSAAHDLVSDSKAPPESKTARRGRKPTAPLRDLSRRSVEESALADPLVDKLLAKEDAKRWEDQNLPTLNLSLGARFAAEDQNTSQSPRAPKLGVKDLQLNIRPSESDVTIWDGLQASVFSFFILTELAD